MWFYWAAVKNLLDGHLIALLSKYELFNKQSIWVTKLTCSSICRIKKCTAEGMSNHNSDFKDLFLRGEYKIHVSLERGKKFTIERWSTDNLSPAASFLSRTYNKKKATNEQYQLTNTNH